MNAAMNGARADAHGFATEPGTPEDVAAVRPFVIRIEPAGRAFEARAEQTVLQAGLAAGVKLPSSCRNGTCRACLCKMTSGSVHYRIEWPGVSRDEREEGYILPCVAHADSDLVIEAPGAA
jgi:ferredoxin